MPNDIYIKKNTGKYLKNTNTFVLFYRGLGVFSMLQINTSVSDGNMFSGDCKRNMSGVWWQGNMVVDRATGTKKTDLSTSLKSLVYLV